MIIFFKVMGALVILGTLGFVCGEILIFLAKHENNQGGKMKREKRSNPIARMRIPLPRQTGGPQGTPKGKRGYDRKAAKKELRQTAQD